MSVRSLLGTRGLGRRAGALASAGLGRSTSALLVVRGGAPYGFSVLVFCPQASPVTSCRETEVHSSVVSGDPLAGRLEPHLSWTLKQGAPDARVPLGDAAWSVPSVGSLSWLAGRSVSYSAGVPDPAVRLLDPVASAATAWADPSQGISSTSPGESGVLAPDPQGGGLTGDPL